MQSRHQPNLANLKAEARRYRAAHAAQGRTLNHARALELVARQHGFADWNTAAASARAHTVPEGYNAGKLVEGRYLGHAFSARISAATSLENGDTYLTLDLVEPVDVVSSDRFSGFRKRISGVIGEGGRSSEMISTGIPQLEILPED